MRTVLAVIVLACSGCAYTDAQIRLVEQAEKGVELCGRAYEERAQLVERFHEMQRERLDEAFDADVREWGELTADWVIEHRRAYAAALDVLSRQRSASAEAGVVFQRNTEAVRETLRRLRQMLEAQAAVLRGEP